MSIPKDLNFRTETAFNRVQEFGIERQPLGSISSVRYICLDSGKFRWSFTKLMNFDARLGLYL